MIRRDMEDFKDFKESDIKDLDANQAFGDVVYCGASLEEEV